MAKDNSGLGSCLLVVGNPGGELAQTAASLAREAGIDAVACDDVYAAVTQIAKTADRRLLIAGRIQDLAREKGSFFRIAAAHAVRCCCLLDKAGPAGRAGDSLHAPSHLGPRTQDLLAAVHAGAAVLSDARDLRDILEEWLAPARRHDAPRSGPESSQAQRRTRDADDASYGDLRATEAELSALLR
jgi:hypothetical protein